MKKQKEISVSPAEKVLASLTGYVASDKKLLISSIHSFRENNVSAEESAKLGVKLYSILLENGLNESDVINPTRLLGKIDGFVYSGKEETAIEILEVLDAIEYYQKYDAKGQQIYYVTNEIEAQILAQNINTKTGNIVWRASLRPTYLNILTNIYLSQNNIKEAQRVNKTALTINPCSFDANLVLAVIYQKISPKKFKDQIVSTWKYAYSKEDMAEWLSLLAEYYEEKKDLTTAYAMTNMKLLYEDEELVNNELAYLENEITKTIISPYKVPTPSEVLNIFEKERLEHAIPVENFKILCDLYVEKIIEDAEPDVLNTFKNGILDFADSKEIIKELQDKAKKMKKEK